MQPAHMPTCPPGSTTTSYFECWVPHETTRSRRCGVGNRLAQGASGGCAARKTCSHNRRAAHFGTERIGRLILGIEIRLDIHHGRPRLTDSGWLFRFARKVLQRHDQLSVFGAEAFETVVAIEGHCSVVLGVDHQGKDGDFGADRANGCIC